MLPLERFGGGRFSSAHWPKTKRAFPACVSLCAFSVAREWFNLRFGFSFFATARRACRRCSTAQLVGRILEVSRRCGSVSHVSRSTLPAVLGIGSILLALGCSNTGIDAIVPVDAGSEEIGGGGAPPTDCSAAVTTVVPGLYKVILDQTGECLARGDVTLIAGTLVTGHEAVLVSDCTQPGALFRIQTRVGDPGFELRNVESDLSLDIEAYETAPSTRAVLFDPTNNDNQRFFFSRQGSSLTRFSIAPAHTFGQCLTVTTFREVQIWNCQEGPYQGWRFVRDECE